MCGILVTSGLKRAFHHGLVSSVRRRGPDEIGFWADQRVQIAHARLSIIGLDERGTEPLENDTHVLVYNGEIYNFIELNRRLRAEGVDIDGANDALVLLHAWSHWGPKVLTELHGFWSFVMYEKASGKLWAVRDQFGVKPLYYWYEGGRFCASSMIRTLLEVLGDSPSLDYDALSEYVRYQFTFGDKTFLSGVKKVLPGHMIEIDLPNGTVKDTCYEDIFAPPSGAKEQLTPELVNELRELMRECVLESTISDTSFTTFCSGGLDSSLITRIATPEIAYHCNYSDPDCNETFFAKQVVDGSSTRLFTVNADESFDLLERLRDIINDFDEPTIGSVILPLEDLLSQVKRRYKVILTGTGGDELFAGYVRYQLAMGECYQDSYTALFSKMKPVKGTAARFEMTHRKGDPSLYAFYSPKAEKTFHESFAQCQEGYDDLMAMLWFDRRYFLTGLLNIDDKMCGRHSLESRPSFLHQKLVRRLKQLDSSAFRTGSELKPTLRKMAIGILPNSVVARTDKMGFTTPIGTFVNHAAHLIREQIQNSHFREFYELKKMSLTAENKFS